MTATPSEGRHLFIKSLGVGSRDGIMPGIDIKAGRPDGTGRGFAFIAPTIRRSKTTGELVSYEWLSPPNLTDMETDNSGETLRHRVEAARAVPCHNGTSASCERIPAGARNKTLTSLAGSMRRRGMSHAAIVAALLEENDARCDPPLPETEVRKVAESVSRYAPAASTYRNGAGTNSSREHAASTPAPLNLRSKLLGCAP